MTFYISLGDMGLLDSLPALDLTLVRVICLENHPFHPGENVEKEEHSSRRLPSSLGQTYSRASTQGLGAGLGERLHTPPKTVQSSSGQQREPKVQD